MDRCDDHELKSYHLRMKMYVLIRWWQTHREFWKMIFFFVFFHLVYICRKSSYNLFIFNFFANQSLNLWKRWASNAQGMDLYQVSTILFIRNSNYLRPNFAYTIYELRDFLLFFLKVKMKRLFSMAYRKMWHKSLSCP